MDFGALNGHSVGTLMKEAVRRAMVVIRGHRFSFEAQTKTSPLGHPVDFVTTADHAAQRVFVKLLREWFPTFGIVAEEGDLSVPCTHPRHDLWFTVDPLDGTKAFMRRQSHGIGAMIALVCDGEVVGACVGDVMTQEVYFSSPGGDDVHRVSEFGIAERLDVDHDRPLTMQWLLLRDRVSSYSSVVRDMVDDRGGEPLFGSVESSSGSIGIALARLWKGEVGGAVVGPIGRANPWDIIPIIGLCQRLGFVFLRVTEDRRFAPWRPALDKGGIPMPQEVLIVHSSRAPELAAWLSRRHAV